MPNQVADKTAAVKEMEPKWTIATDLMGGTATMRKAGEGYMPKWPNEENTAWQNRVNVATLFPAYSRTVKTLTGKPFSKALTFAEEPSTQMKEWTENIDLQGNNLHSFASDLTETAIGWGLAGILVDCPTAPAELTANGRKPTQADEKEHGIRPYMVKIWPSQLLGWRSQRGKDGVEKLLMLRYMECITEPDGEFGEKHTPQVRVLEPGIWRTYREKVNEKGEKEWMLHEEGVTSLSIVPFIPVYGNRIGYMMGIPPMLELAYMNIKHWQSQSDQDTILHVARVPILCVSGVDDGAGEEGANKFELTVGASAAVRLPIGGEMKFVEHTGAGISAGKVSLDDLKEEMRQAGAELLVIKPGSITATQTQAEDSIGMCDLQRIIQSVEDSLDQALAIMGLYAKDDKPGKTNIHSDFSTLGLAEASAELLHRMWQSGALSIEVLLKELQRRGIIAPDVDLEDEKARIEAGGPPPGMTPPTKVAKPPTAE